MFSTLIDEQLIKSTESSSSDEGTSAIVSTTRVSLRRSTEDAFSSAVRKTGK